MACERNSVTGPQRVQLQADTRERIVRLASSLNVIEMSKLPGMPDAQVIYQELATDRDLHRAYKNARNEYWRKYRDEIAEYLDRLKATDLSRMFVELRKIKKKLSEPLPPPAYELELLDLDELNRLHALLAKATPRSSNVE